ncbi:MAG: 23S rRNA (guanosine(2251)-2'-O)-methyltransferase RlmB [Cytophagales bacterium]|nr:23S rRNA (guanosine(2251)-2'-O)-methyltransferase RlmB [Cytophagales bacterium]
MNSKKNADFVFGTQSVLETLRSDKDVERIFIQRSARNESIGDVIRLARELNVPVSQVPIEKMNRITRKNHQGAIAFVSSILYSSLDFVITQAYEDGKVPLIIVLDQVTDVRNFGAIARTAECAGVDAIVIPSLGSAQINSDAMKTSSGALNFIPVCREESLEDAITYLKESGLRVFACSEKATKTLHEVDLKVPAVIMMGNEEKGISKEFLKMSDEHIGIPMFGKVSSLNVGVATAVITYEAVRQRIEIGE